MAPAEEFTLQFRALVATARARLWQERLAALMRRALPASLGLALALLLVHLLWRAVAPAGVVAGALVPLVAVLAVAARRRPSALDAALWADRRFGGGDVLPTCLEYFAPAGGAVARAPSPAALAVLERSGRGALERIVPALDAARVPGVPALASLGVLVVAVTALSVALPGRAPDGARLTAPVPAVGEVRSTASPDAPARVPAPVSAEQAAARELRAALQAATDRPPATAAAAPAGDAASRAPRAGTPPPRSARAGREVDAQASGTVERNSSGREAGTNAAIADARLDDAAARARFDAAFRALRGGAAAGSDGRAAGEALALDPAAGLRDVAAYDATQRALAARMTPAARDERAAATPEGPAALAYLRRIAGSRGPIR